MIAYPDLGPEAIRRLVVKDFPVVVAIDVNGEIAVRRKIVQIHVSVARRLEFFLLEAVTLACHEYQ